MAEEEYEVMSLFDAARAAGLAFAEEVEPKSRFVQVNGLRLHCLDWGNPGKPPMLLLHGGGQTAHSWDFFALTTRPDYHIIALDARGHGDSDWSPDGSYGLDQHQADIEGVIDHLGWQRPIIVGHSMGGRNGMVYASVHPDNIRSLVIVDVGPDADLEGANKVRSFRASTFEVDSFEDFVEMAHRFNPRRSKASLRGSLQHHVKQLPSGKWTWKSDNRRRTGPPPSGDYRQTLWDHVGRIQCPTLIVRGAQSDVFSQAQAEKMLSIIPGSRFALIEGAGHAAYGDNPIQFEVKVKEFLATLARAQVL